MNEESLFAVDEYVFGKVKGYPFWPAKVTNVNMENKKKPYSLWFYGTAETADLPADQITAYIPNRGTLGFPKLNNKFNEGIWQIEYELRNGYEEPSALSATDEHLIEEEMVTANEAIENNPIEVPRDKNVRRNSKVLQKSFLITKFTNLRFGALFPEFIRDLITYPPSAVTKIKEKIGSDIKYTFKLTHEDFLRNLTTSITLDEKELEKLHSESGNCSPSCQDSLLIAKLYCRTFTKVLSKLEPENYRILYALLCMPLSVTRNRGFISPYVDESVSWKFGIPIPYCIHLFTRSIVQHFVNDVNLESQLTTTSSPVFYFLRQTVYSNQKLNIEKFIKAHENNTIPQFTNIPKILWPLDNLVRQVFGYRELIQTSTEMPENDDLTAIKLEPKLE